MKVRVTLRAQLELMNGREFYGNRFVQEYEEAVNKILSYIDMGINAYTPKEKELKRQTIGKYPYHMYYGIDNDTLIIVSVFNYRQNPANAPEGLR